MCQVRQIGGFFHYFVYFPLDTIIYCVRINSGLKDIIFIIILRTQSYIPEILPSTESCR